MTVEQAEALAVNWQAPITMAEAFKNARVLTGDDAAYFAEAFRVPERCLRPRARSSLATRRPAGRRSGSSSRSSGGGSSGDPDLADAGEPARGRHLHLVPDLPPPAAVYSFACLSPEQRVSA